MSEEENVEDFIGDSTDGSGILSSFTKLTKKCITNQSSSIDIDPAPYYNEIDTKEWHVHHGSALIISIEEFDKNQASTRDGTARDEQKMSKMLEQHGFGVQVLTKNDLTCDQITKKLDEFGTEAGKAAQEGRIQCALVVVMTHGYAGGSLLSKDGKIFTVKDIWYPLVKRPELANTPKIFIFQACRGDAKDEGRVANQVTALRGPRRAIDKTDAQADDGPSSRELDATDAQGTMSTAMEDPSSGSVERKDAQGSTTPARKKEVITETNFDVHHPNSPNVLLVYATVDDHVGWRKGNCKGSYFIGALTDQMNGNSKDPQPKDFLSVLIRTNRQLAQQLISRCDLKQTSSFTSYLCYKLYFHCNVH